MAKAIKRVGIIFLALAIICLLAVGVLIGASDTKASENANNSSLNSSNKIENINATNEEELPPIVEEIFLDGTTCEAQAAKWSEAIEKSLTNNGGNHILVTMKTDWIAQKIAGEEIRTSFGAGLGFDANRIKIPKNAIITLDLNGKTINRNLSGAVSSGQAIIVTGQLNVKDSQYSFKNVLAGYQVNPQGNLKDYASGKITGARHTGEGGAVHVFEGGIFILNSGMICDNIAAFGAGVCANNSKIIINDGLIANNQLNEGGTYKGGAGILATDNSLLNVYGGVFHSNGNFNTQTDGGAISVYNSNSNIYNGIFANNKAGDVGSAVCQYGGELNVKGGRFEYNENKIYACIAICRTAKGSISNAYIANNKGVQAAGVWVEVDSLGAKIDNTIIINNISNNSCGIRVDSNLSIGAGLQVYNNKLTTGEASNIHIMKDVTINIADNLLKSGSHMGISMAAGTGVFTSGYSASGNNSSAPSTFFFADETGKSIKRNGDEVQLVNSSEVLGKITWKVDGVGEAGNSYVVLPYTGTPYNLTAFYGSTPLTISTVFGSTLTPVQPGDYSYYVSQPYVNPTFKIVIEEPKKEIQKPIVKTYKMLYENGKLISFYPEGFNAKTMDIAYNMQKGIGKYTASVKLKDAWNTTWEDGTMDTLTYQYEIIPRGIEGKANTGYENIYLDNGYRKNYSDNKYTHLINDSEIATINGNTRYVLGNISCETSVKTFIGNLQNESNTIKIYDNNSTIIYDGIASNGVVADNLNNKYVATGYKVEYYWNNNLYDTAYLSVLGDVVADGVINTLDVTFVNRIAKGEIKLDTLSIERQLAAMVDNKGKVTSTDGKILLNVIGGNLVSQDYFGNVASNKDNYQLWNLKEEGGKTFRESIDLTTAGLVDNAIIGNISLETTAVDFKTKFASQLGVADTAITIYNAKGNELSESDIIGTGYYINYDSKTIYLSVLGDLTGDGRVNTTDVTYLNRLVNGSITLDTSNIKDKLTMLAATIQNKGKLTTADSETILNYIGNNVDIKQYF